MPDRPTRRAGPEPIAAGGRPTTVTPTRRHRSAAWAAALLLVLLVPACGDGTTAGTAADRTASAPTTAAGATRSTAPSQPPGATAPDGPITLTGTVEAGVEPGCLLLDGYLLIGGPAQLQAGGAWTISGRVDRAMITTCQQGVPVVVDTADPA